MGKNKYNETELDTNKVDKMMQDLIKELNNYKLNVKNYVDNDNNNEPIFYIVLNKDAMVDKGIKLSVISHLTSLMYNKFYNKEFKLWKNELKYEEWLDSYKGYGNTIILEASEDELYDNCMSDYDNIEFIKYIDDSTRVAHHNWKLDIPQHIGVAFFGIKNEMPKWVRCLPLAK